MEQVRDERRSIASSSNQQPQTTLVQQFQTAPAQQSQPVAAQQSQPVPATVTSLYANSQMQPVVYVPTQGPSPQGVSLASKTYGISGGSRRISVVSIKTPSVSDSSRPLEL